MLLLKMGRSQHLFVYFHPFNITIQILNRKSEAKMLCLGSEPRPQDSKRTKIHWAMKAAPTVPILLFKHGWLPIFKSSLSYTYVTYLCNISTSHTYIRNIPMAYTYVTYLHLIPMTYPYIIYLWHIPTSHTYIIYLPNIPRYVIYLHHIPTYVKGADIKINNP